MGTTTRKKENLSASGIRLQEHKTEKSELVAEYPTGLHERGYMWRGGWAQAGGTLGFGTLGALLTADNQATKYLLPCKQAGLCPPVQLGRDILNVPACPVKKQA